MKEKFNFKKFAGIGVSAVMAVMLAFGVVFTDKSLNAEPDSASGNAPTVSEFVESKRTAATYATSGDELEKDSASGLYTYKAGSSYWFIDYTKGTQYAPPTGATADTDIVNIDVDTTKAKGDKLNPYVINSKEDWATFVTFTNTAANQTKCYVLNADLDYAGAVIPSVKTFSGTFYGNGHKISNAQYAAANANTSQALGLFDRATGTVYISDLIIENLVVPSNNIEHVGGLIGHSCATNFTLVDIVVTGSLTGTNPVQKQTGGFCGIGYHLGYGGLVGQVHTGTGNVYVYKCATDVKITLTNSGDWWIGIGGFFGGHDGVHANQNQNSTNVYDSYAAADVTYTGVVNSTATYLWGGMIGYPRAVSNITFKRCISIYKITCPNASKVNPGVFCTTGGPYSSGSQKYTLENCYGYGNITRNGASKALPIVAYYDQTRVTGTLTNCALYSDYKSNGFYGNVASMSTTVNNAAKASIGDLIATAKTACYNPGVWDTDVMSKITTSSRPNIVQTPILVNRVRISYYNLITTEANGEKAYPETNGEFREVKFGDTLCGPAEISELTRPNRTFVGWTSDITGKGEAFTYVPKSWHGDTKIYAVWKATTASVSISASGDGSDFGPDTENGGYSMTFNGTDPGRGITLTANLTVPNMDNPQGTYQWSKGGVKVEVGGTGASYEVKNVRQSGDYNVTVTFHDNIEPLFMGEVDESKVDAVKTTIKPAELKCDGVTFENGRPYSGAPYTTAVPTAIVKDKEEGTRVKGETKWFIDLSTFNNDGNSNATIDKEKNTETTKIIFTPDEEYGGNYGEEKDFTVTFTIEYLKFIFDIPRISNLKLEVNLEYGQHYTYNNVVTMFEEVFEPYLGNLAGNTPAFIVDEQIVKINDYRKWPVGGGSTTAYGNVTKSYTIEVTFVPQSYTVTFNAKNGDPTTNPESMDIGHGIRIPKPNDPTNKGQLFLGWFYDYTDPDTKQTKTNIAWNFDVDRVTHELELYAKWLQADKLIGLTVTPSPLIEYIAKKTVDPAYLTVKAIFEGTDEDTGTTVTQEMVLNAGQYIITYEGGKTALHAKLDPEEKSKITFKYTYNGTTVTAELNVVVQKILVDTSVLKQFFKDTAVVVNGSAQSIKEIDPMRISQLLPDIAGCKVEYKYFNSNEDEIDPSEVVNVGKYYARAYFTPTDVDYDAPFIQAIFQIVTERIKLSIDWGETEFVFNGKEQRPMPTFKDGDEEVNANYTYTITKVTNPSEVLQPIKARTDYLITIELEDLAYELGGMEYKAFSIVPAVLKVPTQIKQFPYIGQEYDLNALSESECEVFFSDFDLSMMRVNAGDNIKGDKGTNAGRYNASIILLDPDSSKFEDGTSKTTMPWQIAKAQLTVEWDSYEFYENMPKTVPEVLSLYEFYGDDGEHFKMSDLDYMGDILATTSGEYTIVISIKPEAEWASNYELDKTKTCNFVILPRAGMEIITLEWDSNTLFTFNGQVQHPTFKVKNKVGGYVEDINMNLFRYNDESQNSRWAGDYEMIVSLPATSNYYLTGKTNCYYTILVNSEGMGNKPGEGPTQDPELKPGGDDVGGNPGNNTMNLPLWQLIVTGVSAVLFVVCAAKAFSEYGKLKEAKRKGKELASISYAVTYGFAPLPLLALGVGETFLGLGNMAWTVIAFVALGVFLISLIAMLMLSKKRKAAELVVEREQARIDEEKEYMRQEEQRARDEQIREDNRRRDEEMKMMFASMQQGFQQQAALNYGDMQNMLAASMQALLPAMTQQMAALPPAQSDPSAYADPYAQQQAPQYGAPQYGAPQYGAPAPQYGAPSSDTDELRAKLERQEALINQLMQERQGAQAAYANYEEDAHDEALWQDDGDVVSLEESYGRLSDEAKRCYYELGSYIMNKPKIAQNDGKYAVLFKYRGKTMFKLCIRGDAPVLFYNTDNGVRESVRVADSSGLSAAKSVVDMAVIKRDRELGN